MQIFHHQTPIDQLKKVWRSIDYTLGVERRRYNEWIADGSNIDHSVKTIWIAKPALDGSTTYKIKDIFSQEIIKFLKLPKRQGQFRSYLY